MLFRRRPKKPINSTELLEPPFALPIPLEFRRSDRARRLSLRLDQARGRVVLSAPLSVTDRHALDFLSRCEGWLQTRIARMPVSIALADGVTIPILGKPHLIKADHSRLRGVVQQGDGIITVPGLPEHLPRRLTDFLKTEARREIEWRVRIKARELGRPIADLTLRDTKSRWGSCNSIGRLNFSWRLIMAPEPILDYVIAHEVAHLAEMNHGARFWRLCASLTETEPKAARAWLKRHGPALHSYR